jgi:hypothetical protein
MADPTLPAQTPTTLDEKIAQVHAQQALLARMREGAASDPRLARDADALAAQYHVRDVADLAKDVYRAAAHEQAPASLGWLRASEHPDLLREMGVNWSDQRIHDFLQPDGSDARAEIYLPDPKVYGTPPSVEPVLAFKGSNGGVALPGALPGPDGKVPTRESALEDWVENARQGIGLKSDHYDRSMDLATALKQSLGSGFEITGHSKGGGQATAAAAVTGLPTYTFNAASLHPDTPTRYAAEHGIRTFPVDPLVHAYHVKGEVLHDALGGVHDMDAATRAQAGRAAEQFGELSQVADARALARSALAKALPYDPKMQADAVGLLDHLATHSGRDALKGVPLPAGGDQIELAPKSRDAAGNLVDRPKQPSLGAVAGNAGPLMDVVSGALEAGVIGKRAGDVVASGGRVVDQGAQLAGAGSRKFWEISGQVADVGVRTDGQIVGATIRYGGEAIAGARVAGGQAESLLNRAEGQLATWSNATNSAVLRAASHLPFLDHLKDAADRNDRATAAYADGKRTQAGAALADARADATDIRRVANSGANTVVGGTAVLGDAIRKDAGRVGGLVESGYQGVGDAVRGVTDKAPAVGAGIGLLTGTVMTARHVYLDLPYGPFNAYQTYQVATQAKGAALEAVDRHAMQEVVFPSLDARTRQMEGDAAKRLQAVPAPAQDAPKPTAPTTGKSALLMDDPLHPGFPLFRDASRGVDTDRDLRALPANARANLSGALAEAAYGRGWDGITHVKAGLNGDVVFGVKGDPGDFANPTNDRLKIDRDAALNTTLAQSTQRLDDLQATRKQDPQQTATLDRQDPVEREARARVA